LGVRFAIVVQSIDDGGLSGTLLDSGLDRTH
jgi:hypothetical protein